MTDRFITENIGDELLVYDTHTHDAVALSPELSQRWKATRRVLRRRHILTLAIAAGASIIAPSVAQAASHCQVTQCHRGDLGRTCNNGHAECGRCFDEHCL